MSMLTNSQLRLQMPAEWEPHVATWLAWPHNLKTWPGHFEPVPHVWVEMIRALHVFEPVHVCVKDQAMESQALQLLEAANIQKNVFFHLIATNDVWIRDHGPIFVRDLERNQPLILDWIFNSWGQKYGPFDLDDVVPQKVSKLLDIPFLELKWILEGGSIDTNGQGCLLTTEQCLLNPNRNSQLSKEEIESLLKQYLGVQKILWLGEGIVGDDTDGHIDDITRFVNPNTIVTVIEEDPSDENYQLLQENLRRLQKMTDLNGKPFEIVTIPMPGPVFQEDQRLPASYANFYIANQTVLMPTYRHANDVRALATLQKLFPNRRVVGIDCTDLVWGLGAIHCVTQQQPQI